MRIVYTYILPLTFLLTFLGVAVVTVSLLRKDRSCGHLIDIFPLVFVLAIALYFATGFTIAPIFRSIQSNIATPYVIEAISEQCNLELEELPGEFLYDSGYIWQSDQSNLSCTYGGKWTCYCS